MYTFNGLFLIFKVSSRIYFMDSIFPVLSTHVFHEFTELFHFLKPTFAFMCSILKCIFLQLTGYYLNRSAILFFFTSVAINSKSSSGWHPIFCITLCSGLALCEIRVHTASMSCYFLFSKFYFIFILLMLIYFLCMITLSLILRLP